MLGQDGFLKVNGAEIYYEVTGEGTPIVFLHRVPLDSRMWDTQMADLSDRFKVIRFDYRGLGKTVATGSPFTLYSDIHALLQMLQIDSAYFVGVSFGSYVGVEFALAHPEMVQGLILACPGAFQPPSEDWQLLMKKMQEELQQGNIEEALEINMHVLLDGPEQQKGRVQLNREWLQEIYRDIFNKPPSQARPTLLEPHPSERLAEVQVPTLVISGEFDHADFKRTADILAANIPNAKHVTFKNSAHFPSIDSPDEFNEMVVSFVKEN